MGLMCTGDVQTDADILKFIAECGFMIYEAHACIPDRMMSTDHEQQNNNHYFKQQETRTNSKHANKC